MGKWRDLTPDFMRLLGLENYEKFYVVEPGGEYVGFPPYSFIDGRLADHDGHTAESYVILRLLSGFYGIERLPWRPDDGESFWYIDVNGYAIRDVFSGGSTIHVLLARIGNCFKTERGARSQMDHIMKKMMAAEGEKI